MGNCDTSSSSVSGKSSELNEVPDQVELITAIYGTFPSIAAERMVFYASGLSDDVRGHKASLSKYRKMEITSQVLF